MYALDEVTVLSLENGVSAPLCTRILADLGADVVKIERPGVGDVNRSWGSSIKGHSAPHVWVDRNKQSLELNLKSDEGRDIFLELAADADVIVQNFLPGTVERLGLEYETIKEVNEEVIYVNISGYGSEGPYRNRKAYDLIMQGETGIIMMNGSPDAPAKSPLSICDINAGTNAAMGALTSLFHRERTGVGQEVDVNMFSGILSWISVNLLKYWYQDEIPDRIGMRHHNLTPYGPHRTSDGEYISFACLSEKHFELFCTEVIEVPELLEDERFESNERRMEHRAVFEDRIEREMETKPYEHWVEKLEGLGIPWGDVNHIDDVASHPQVDHLDLVTEVDTAEGPVKVLQNPIEMSAADVRYESVPELGEDSERILRELGYEQAEIDSLAELGVI